MSTYNGEQYIKEQIESILTQLPPDGRLLIRDDGSRDATVSLIKQANNPAITLVQGENIGFAKSFITLLHMAPPDSEMLMFADQDDVWLQNKIERAWQVIKTSDNKPILYCSAQTLVDEKLKPLETTAPWARPPSFKGAISENIVTGCTAAMSPTAAEILRRTKISNNIRFHDWWSYLVISAFGDVYVDNTPTILYRQHSNNQIGRGAGWIGRQIKIMRFLQKNDWVQILLDQITELKQVYGDELNWDKRKLIEKNFHFSDGKANIRWHLVFSGTRWRQTVLSEVLFRVLLLAKKISIYPISSGRRINKRL